MNASPLIHQVGQLPPFLRDLIENPPRAGEGIHNWLFKVARQLHVHMPAVEIVNLLETRVKNCGRHVSRKEIEDAVKNSISSAYHPNGKVTNSPTISKWPPVNQEQQEAVVRDNGGLADLYEASNPRIEDTKQYTEWIIDNLFPGNPLLCCGESQSVFVTKSREDWRGKMDKLQFIVPSPMSAVTGMTQDGKVSCHTLDNTGARRFLVCEFDNLTTEKQAAILLHLGECLPLVCVLSSGGKSMHGWFLVAGFPKHIVEKFFRYAVNLGADRATWTRSQFVRMPDGTRDNGKIQRTYFTNFQSLKGKI